MTVWTSWQQSDIGRRLWASIPRPPPLNFITIHYAYFIGTCLVSSVIFWAASTPPRSISYTDSLFLVTSAITEAGLNTVNLSEINTFQQVFLWIHIMIGSAIFVSCFVVFFRKKTFEARFTHVIEAEKERRRQSQRRTPAHQQSRLFRPLSRSRPSISTSSPAAVELNDTGVLSQPNQPLERQESSGFGKADPQESSDKGPPMSAKDPSDILSQARASAVDNESHVTFDSETLYTQDGASTRIQRRHPRVLTFSGVGANTSQASFHRIANSNRASNSRHDTSQDGWHEGLTTELHHQPLDFLGNIEVRRNSQFHGLTREQRERLGGIEYRAISLLSWIVPIYFVLWQLLGCIGLGAYMAYNRPSVALENGLNPWWLGIFNAVSAFNNSGMSLLDANMIPFQTSSYTLCTMGLLILAGNTAYPLFLRLILWIFYKVLPDTPRFTPTKETLSFVLRYPRRVYTNLFPSRPTWWLFFSLVVLNATDWIAFELLNIGNKTIEAIPHNYRVLDGLFQALAVRSGGFYVVSISNVRIGLQVLYVLMMYISVYPVVITMRNSNVYEERSLGIYSNDPITEDFEDAGFFKALRQRISGRAFDEESRYFLRQQLRGQLAHDLWWLMLSLLLIVCIETGQFEADPVTYSVFNVAFEIVSGYGCVGISTGLPDQAYSFSGGWHTTSKLILCAVMIRGRHRGLPVAIDRAINVIDQPQAGGEAGPWETHHDGSRTRNDEEIV